MKNLVNGEIKLVHFIAEKLDSKHKKGSNSKLLD